MLSELKNIFSFKGEGSEHFRFKANITRELHGWHCVWSTSIPKSFAPGTQLQQGKLEAHLQK